MIKLDALAIVIGVGLASFLLFYFSTMLEKEHFLLKLLCMIFGVGLLLLIPNSLINSQTVCEPVINTTTELYQYGNNFTGYHWDYDAGTAPDGPQTDAYLFHKNTTNYYSTYCYTITNGTNNTFLKSILWFFRLFITYIILYLGYQSLMILKDSFQKGGRRG